MYESRENYLETILILSQKNGSVRSIDIARELNFSKPSVSRAMRLLRESGHIITDENGGIVLTELGLKKAKSVLERHQILTEFLMKTTGVSEGIVEKDACRMEHIVSEEVFEGIKKFVKNKSQ
ncbi:metal-dependent transcriptional regulator [[Clostridium] polysaccharolyticum]|uniref:Iron (Metal) dependent repressor, DtxR family n=1 Tax=[Clostridium] polysaccharolyticum TaxID=29364 RepID=A0A1I0BLU5_9FIRM|nr:metal-dependent transcriptional regulator [[Clostridium] polysaccharolyticum]SET07921.1 iron (metal) dependent repressor, DtxR family [[Clostridium] polysaccharolyticum]